MTVADGTATDLARRLARFRAAQTEPGTVADPLPHRPIAAAELAERMAATLGGEVVETDAGRFVRVEGASIDLPVDRRRLAGLPGHPDAGRPLVCLDTETTGLATAAGTVAFLIGIGWWEGRTFRQLQLLLPDHGQEPAMLDELARHLPTDAWLVTYNGRGFDWPLLVTRFRMCRRPAPTHDGHLDLLPLVRRMFRHRMDDARLRTAERMLLGLVRHDDVDGWEIPGRYLGFLRGGPAHPLAAVVRHNDEDVRSLARLIALLDAGYAAPDGRRSAPAGDLAGLARAFVRAHRPAEALACLEEVLARPERAAAPDPAPPPRDRVAVLEPWRPAPPQAETPWWSPQARADFGGPPRRDAAPSPWHRTAAFAATWDTARIQVDRAHLLRRLGRYEEAAGAWAAIAAGPGRTAILAWIELAKLREHRLGDPFGALAATQDGLHAVERRRRLGMPEPGLEADLRGREQRLRRRVARSVARAAGGQLARGARPDRAKIRDAGQAEPLDRE